MKSVARIGMLLLSFYLASACQKKDLETTPENTPTQPAAPPMTTTPVATGEVPKLNPPHGEPFHRCDIAVGAPLDGPSNPNAETTTTSSGPKTFFKTVQNTNPNPAPSPTATTATPTPQTTPAAQATTPKPKLNPAHGQPHHRCDIAVGAPLD